MINYSMYLFSCLLKIYDKEFSELEYDLQFEQLPVLYGEFQSSNFDEPLKGEYECILAYLKDKYPNANK